MVFFVYVVFVLFWKMHSFRSILIVLIVQTAIVQSALTKKRPDLVDCDIKKIQNTGPIILKFINDQPAYLGNFSTPTPLICKTGQFSTKLVDHRINLKHHKISDFHPNDLKISYKNVTSTELSLLTLPFNLHRINASHNIIALIPYGMCGADEFSSFLVPFFLWVFISRIGKFAARFISFGGRWNFYAIFFNSIFSTLIVSDTFPVDNQLKVIDLSFNRITTLTMSSFQRLKQLERLILTHNRISTLPAFLFHSMENLIELDLSANVVDRIDDYGFFGVKNLQKLDLEQNQVNKIRRKMFAPLVKLKRLNLAQNKLMEIDFGTFASLENLRTLDLSGNRLKQLDLDIFPMHPNRVFELLNIANNELKELVSIDSATISNGVIFGIDDNRINCTHFKQIFAELTAKHLDSFATLENCTLNGGNSDDESIGTTNGNSSEMIDLEAAKNLVRKIRSKSSSSVWITKEMQKPEHFQIYNENHANIDQTKANQDDPYLILIWLIAICLVIILVVLCFLLERQQHNYRYENVQINFKPSK